MVAVVVLFELIFDAIFGRSVLETTDGFVIGLIFDCDVDEFRVTSVFVGLDSWRLFLDAGSTEVAEAAVAKGLDIILLGGRSFDGFLLFMLTISIFQLLISSPCELSGIPYELPKAFTLLCWTKDNNIKVKQLVQLSSIVND